MEETEVATLTKEAKTDPIAQYNLGVYYQRGIDGKADLKRAVKWWEKSAEAGYAPAQYNLGVAYEKGVGVKKSGEKALYYYEEAAKQRFAPAEYNLGVCYLNGEIVGKDPRRALFYYNAAASHGHKEALNAVGRLLGEIVK